MSSAKAKRVLAALLRLGWHIKREPLTTFESGTIFPNMRAENIKEEAKRLLDRLPDDLTWEELMHEIYVRQSIEAGLSDSKEGKTVNVTEVRQRFGLTP